MNGDPHAETGPEKHRIAPQPSRARPSIIDGRAQQRPPRPSPMGRAPGACSDGLRSTAEIAAILRERDGIRMTVRGVLVALRRAERKIGEELAGFQ
jgi:hypothetical protein